MPRDFKERFSPEFTVSEVENFEMTTKEFSCEP